MSYEIVNDDWLREKGIDPEAPFSTCPRVAGDPFEVQHGTHKLRRSKSGAFEISYGYFSESSKRCRDLIYEKAAAELSEKLRSLGILPLGDIK